jgi:hypothetical protein
VEEPGEPGPAEPSDGVRVGVAGGEEPQRGVVAQVRCEGGVPGRAEDLQQRIEPGQGRGAPLDQRRVQLGGPPQRVTGSQPALGMQPLGVQQRQPGEQDRVQPVGFGVLGVVGAQVRGPLGRDQHHGRAPTTEPGRQRNPGVAGRLHHHRDLSGCGGLDQPGPQPVQLGGLGAEPMPGPQQLPTRVGGAGLMRCTHRDVDPPANDHSRTPISLADMARQPVCRGGTISARHSLTGIHTDSSSVRSPGS